MYKEYKVKYGEGRILLLDYMTGSLDFSSRQSKKLIKEGRVHVNGKAAFRDTRLKNGNTVEINMAEEQNNDILPEAIELSIIYEDASILAVNKPPYMLVHPTPNHPKGTLLNAVAYYFREQGKHASLRLLNRLDMNTSGIVIIPKSAAVHSKLEEIMKAGSIRKFYTAVVDGAVKPESGRIEEPIGKDEADPIKRTVRSDGQPSVTVYETMRSTGTHSLVRLELLTGRTHQIRVHLAYKGCPVTGDELYGEASDYICRQALHASDMELPHPGGNGILKLHAELPEDFAKLLKQLKLE